MRRHFLNPLDAENAPYDHDIVADASPLDKTAGVAVVLSLKMDPVAETDPVDSGSGWPGLGLLDTAR